MGNTRLLFAVVVVLLSVFVASASAQGTFAPGTVVQLQGTPHLWFAGEDGKLHWGGDTRALSGRQITWNERVVVHYSKLLSMPIGDPWLSAGLLKDGDPIYLVKWETGWEVPQLLHITSIKDVELFGINGSNYGNFVIDKPIWEARFSLSADDLQRGVLSSAYTSESAATPTPVPPTPTPLPAPTIDYKEMFRNNEQYVGQEFYFTGKIVQVIGSSVFRVDVADDYSSHVVYLSGYRGKRLLEDDKIEFVGRVLGLHTYRSIFGQSITIPHLQAVSVQLIE